MEKNLKHNLYNGSCLMEVFSFFSFSFIILEIILLLIYIYIFIIYNSKIVISHD